MKIIGFNGPPRSGKDTLATAIQDIHEDEYREAHGHFAEEPTQEKLGGYPWMQPENIFREALIMPCRIAAFALMGLGAYNLETYERIKDKVNPAFGVSLRQFMIRLMEDHVKILYGRGVAGETLANKYRDSALLRLPNLMLVTDIGFQEEVDILSELVGYDNFLLVHVIREGTTWSGDSRNWCRHDNIFRYENLVDPLAGAHRIMEHAHYNLGWEFV